jgi:hypothetical protein
MQPIIEQLAVEIQRIYQEDRTNAAILIEKYLDKQLQGIESAAKIQIVSLLEAKFSPPSEPEESPEKNAQKEFIRRFCALILGKELSSEELISAETLERLSLSLNTIFDSLNQLVHSIRQSLFLENMGDATIRRVIGSSLNKEESTISLEQYLGEIKSAFLMSHHAFRLASGKMIERILQGLDPKQTNAAAGNSFIPAMRKANAFDRYEQLFETFRQWHDSGRSMEDFLKEFERECQTLAQQYRR